MTHPATYMALVVMLVGAVCLGGVLGGTVTAATAEHDDDNETVQHENPDEFNDEGNLTAVQRWLGDEMTEVHLDCAENLSLGEAAACERLDDEYPDYLSRYGSVEREREGDTNTSETFNQTRENQTELVESLNEFNETYEEYQAAREAGDEERALALARELQRLSERIEARGGNLTVLLERLERTTGRNTESGQNSINETVVQAEEITRTVELETFIDTTLTATVANDTATVTRPTTVTGELTADNGSAIAGAPLVVVVDGREIATTQTDASGSYEATYRPSAAETTGSTTVRVVYDPSLESEYLGATATDAVVVEAVAPDVALETDAAQVAFGDTVRVTGTVTVDGRPAASAPVAVFLGDERLANGSTGADGQVQLRGPVPATVPDGDRELRLAIAESDRAVAPAEATQGVTVEETETELRLQTTRDDGALVVNGTLTTADGQAVPSQTVSVDVAAAGQAQPATGAAGRYQARIPVDADESADRRVAVEFDGEGTNLAPTRRTRTVDITGIGDASEGAAGDASEGAAEQNGSSSRPNPITVLLIILFVVVDIVLIGLVFRRYQDPDATIMDLVGDEAPEDVDPAPVAADESTQPEEPADPSPSEPPQPDPFDVAYHRLEDGATAEAVRIGYGAVRETFDSDEDSTQTHWEFYRDTAAELSDDASDALETLTEIYEQAAFAPSGVDRTTAESAIEAAAACLETPSTTDGGADHAD